MAPETKYGGTVKQAESVSKLLGVQIPPHSVRQTTVLSPTQGTRGGYSLEKVKQNVSGLGDTTELRAEADHSCIKRMPMPFTLLRSR